jgi:prophage antirepressor-like protein
MPKNISLALIEFVFESASVRFAGTSEKPLVVAADLCQALDVVNVSQAIDRLDDDEKELICLTYTDLSGIERTTNALALTESGMYSLILTSRKAVAKRLKKWVTSEVLPSIRKTGSYSVSTTSQDLAGWHEQRLKGKAVRRSLTDTIKIFCQYAEAQGSQNADQYYRHFSSLINKYIIEAPIDSKIKDKRNRMADRQLRYVAVIEDALSKLIDDRMVAGDEYHEVYAVCRDRVAAIAAVLDIVPAPLLPESNQQLINQSLTRSLKATV